MLLKAAGIGGSLLVLVALVITLLKTAIGFFAFITLAIKIIIALAFILLIVGVGFLVFKGFQNNRRNKD